MARPRIVTDLQVWMIETGRSDSSLAAELTARLRDLPSKNMRNTGKTVTDRTVARWRKGLFVPRYPQHLAILADLSGGRVTANSFAEARLREHFGESIKSSELEKLDGEAAAVASRLHEQLRGVRGAVAVVALADVTASILATRNSGGDFDQDRLDFERLLSSRLDGYR